VTTATDVYALGGLLYRLLTGRRPYGAPGKAAAQLAFDVLQTEPRAAAEVVTQRTGDGADAAALAALRATTPRLLSRQLGGDLDAIVAKALRKEAAGRYPDARALADDLERYLNHEPVRARDGARAYRWRRFIRRNWMPVSALAALIVVLMAGIAAVAWQAAQTRREAQRASAVTDFLISMFRASDPRIAQDQPRGRITARDLLDRSAARIPSHFADDPETEIRLLGVTADIYRELDETDRYRELHRQQIELARRLYGDLHPAITKGLLDEAEMDIDRDHGNDALKLLDEADPLIRRAGRDRTAVRARWLLLRSQALSFSERYAAERQRDALAAVALYRDVAPQDPGRVSALSELGTYSYERDDYRTAIGEYIKAIALAQTLPNRDDGELTIIYNNLALAYEVVGEFDAAEKAYRAAEDLTERTYGKHHRNYWKLYADHARLVHLRGDRLRALQMFDALETLIPADAPMGVELAEVRFEQAASLLAEGRPQLAIPMLEACKRFYVKWPLNDFTVRRVRAALGDAYAATGRLDAARRELKQALDEYVAREAPDSDGVRDTRERWGRLLMLEHDDAGAAAQFREIIARGGRHVDSETVRAWADLTQLATRRGDADAAEDARHALQAYKNLSGYFDVRIGPYVWARAAAALLVSGDAAGAAGLAGQALDASRRYDAPESVEIGAAAATLAAARQALGRTAAAPAEPGSAPALTPAAKPVDHALAQPPSR
jgi:serine/threonine-protein kinase